MKKIFLICMALIVTIFCSGCKNEEKVENSNNEINEKYVALLQNYDHVYDFVDGYARVVKENKSGVIDEDGQEIVPCTYDWIFINDFYDFDYYSKFNSLYDFNFFVTKNNNKYGIIDKKGNEIIACKYDQIEAYDKELIEVFEEGKGSGCIDKSGNLVIPCEYSYLWINDNGLVEVTKDKKEGLLDKSGKEILPCVYDEIDYYYGNDDLRGIKKDGKYGAVDNKGNIVVPLGKYDYLWLNFKDIIEVKKNDKYGALNNLGVEVIPTIYDDIDIDEYNDVIWVVKNQKVGIIDKTGKEMIPLIYDGSGAPYFSYDLAIVEKDGKCGCIDKNYKEVIPCIYDTIERATLDLLMITKDNKVGIVDKEGKEIIPLDYYDFKGVENKAHSSEIDFVITEKWDGGAGYYRSNTKYGIIDPVSKKVTPCIYDDISTYNYNPQDGLIEVKKDGKYGVIDKSGNEIVPLIYDDIYVYSGSNIVKVWKDGKCGALDKNTGKEVIAIGKYDNVYYLVDDLYGIVVNGKYGVMNKNEKVIIPCKYEYISNGGDGLFYVRLDEKEGYVDTKGKEVIPCIYDNIFDDNTMYHVWKDGKQGYLDKKGKEIIPCIYNEINVISDDCIAVCDYEKGVAFVNSKGEKYGMDIFKTSLAKENMKVGTLVFPNKYLEPVPEYDDDCNCGDGDYEIDYTPEMSYSATSTLKEGKTIYFAGNLDVWHSNSWVEGVEGYGIGEKIQININRSAYSFDEENFDFDEIKNDTYTINGFWLVNGFAKDEKLWQANARVKKMKITIDDAKEYIVDVKDTRALQYVDVNYTSDTTLRPIKIVAEILEVYEGDKYQDTALSLLEPVVSFNK